MLLWLGKGGGGGWDGLWPDDEKIARPGSGATVGRPLNEDERDAPTSRPKKRGGVDEYANAAAW